VPEKRRVPSLGGRRVDPLAVVGDQGRSLVLRELPDGAADADVAEDVGREAQRLVAAGCVDCPTLRDAAGAVNPGAQRCIEVHVRRGEHHAPDLRAPPGLIVVQIVVHEADLAQRLHDDRIAGAVGQDVDSGRRRVGGEELQQPAELPDRKVRIGLVDLVGKQASLRRPVEAHRHAVPPHVVPELARDLQVVGEPGVEPVDVDPDLSPAARLERCLDSFDEPLGRLAIDAWRVPVPIETVVRRPCGAPQRPELLVVRDRDFRLPAALLGKGLPDQVLPGHAGPDLDRRQPDAHLAAAIVRVIPRRVRVARDRPRTRDEDGDHAVLSLRHDVLERVHEAISRDHRRLHEIRAGRTARHDQGDSHEQEHALHAHQRTLRKPAAWSSQRHAASPFVDVVSLAMHGRTSWGPQLCEQLAGVHTSSVPLAQSV
jgi:hypothetical protein